MEDVIVVGGGIAGLSVANALSDRGARVCLLEREARVATQASGNNAAIFRPLEERAESSVFPRRSRELLLCWLGRELLDPSGLLLLANAIEPLQHEAARARLSHEIVERAQLAELAPSLAGGDAERGLLLHDGGVLDVPGLTSALAERARRSEVDLRTSTSVRALNLRANRVTGVVLRDGTELSAGVVVLAAGAWNLSLSQASNLALPLLPLSRQLVQLTAAGSQPEPVVWRLDDEVYYRRAGSEVLASPCDEKLSAPGGQNTDPNAPSDLKRKLERLAPQLARGAVLRAWACLRTFAADRELVVGADPRAVGLYWLGGLGGRGMCVAPAAAEALAAIIAGDTPRAIGVNMSPARLLVSKSG